MAIDYRAIASRCLLLVLVGVGLLAPARGFAVAVSPSPPRAMFAESRISVQPRITVETIGEGPDVVLIPGWSNSSEVWRRTAERLRGSYRVHLVQVAGFAGEPARANASGPVLVPTASAIEDYILQEGLVRPAVIGHSMGGTMALWLAQHHPDDIGRVMLVDAIPSQAVVDPDAGAEAMRARAAKMRDRIRQTDFKAPGMRARLRSRVGLLTTSAEGDRILDWAEACDETVRAQAYYDLGLLDLRPGLASVSVPVTILFPVDPALTANEALEESVYRAVYAPLTSARLVRVQNSRHFIMYDQPNAFDAELDEFLRQD